MRQQAQDNESWKVGEKCKVFYTVCPMDGGSGGILGGCDSHYFRLQKKPVSLLLLPWSEQNYHFLEKAFTNCVHFIMFPFAASDHRSICWLGASIILIKWHEYFAPPPISSWQLIWDRWNRWEINFCWFRFQGCLLSQHTTLSWVILNLHVQILFHS